MTSRLAAGRVFSASCCRAVLDVRPAAAAATVSSTAASSTALSMAVTEPGLLPVSTGLLDGAASASVPPPSCVARDKCRSGLAPAPRASEGGIAVTTAPAVAGAVASEVGSTLDAPNVAVWGGAGHAMARREPLKSALRTHAVPCAKHASVTCEALRMRSQCQRSRGRRDCARTDTTKRLAQSHEQRVPFVP